MEARYQLRQSPAVSCDSGSLADTWPLRKIEGLGRFHAVEEVRSALGVVAHDGFGEGTGVPFLDAPAVVAAR